MTTSPDQSTPDESAHRFPPWALALALIALTALALALRLVRLREIGLWYDEAFGLLIARMPWDPMNQTIGLDVHPPLWFWLLHLWGTDSVLWARLFGVALGTATVPVVWLAARRALGDSTALVAAGLLAIHPLHVFYSQELRMYALQGLLIAAMIGAAFPVLRARGAWSWWGVALFACALGVMMTQYLGGAVVGGLWVGLLAARWGRLDRPWTSSWVIFGVMALAPALGYLLPRADFGFVSAHGGHGSLGVQTLIQALEGTQGLIRTPPWRWLGLGGGSLLWAEIGAAVILVLAIAGVRILVADPRRRPAGILLGCTLFGGLLLLIAYQVAGFLFFTRFYVILVVPTVILMAVGLGEGPRWWRWLATALVAGTLLSHTAGVLQANGHVRGVSGRLIKWIEARGGVEAMPPLLCDQMFLAMPLHAQLPGALIRVPFDEEVTVTQVMILTEMCGYLKEENLPENWTQRPVWIALSGWGGAPLVEGRVDEAEMLRRAGVLAREIGGEAGPMRLLRFDAIAGGFKWAAIVEMR
ncbi:glycosyltransferase family 39 protein [Candidatus Sumerlaeota bacterium]|nr:glycosyltransferase family 39 protein [Candidatus Sumerlaeota bacterium]